MKENRNEISHNNKYSIKELKEIVDSSVISKYDNSYCGVPVFKINSSESLPGEVFRPYLSNPKHAKSEMRALIDKNVFKGVDIEVSNLGRIKKK